MENQDIQNIPFQEDENVKKSIIKVVGVGGGGGNAVNYMYKEGIHDVSFVVVNTDSKALSVSSVPHRLQLGSEGLGAGNKPDQGRAIAEQCIDDIRAMLDDGTKMVFITAGMGGGTGTGAAPVIAKCARDLNILTVGIVTIPFAFEGIRKIDQALDGVDAMAKNVDALIVINNERLRQLYPSFTIFNGFSKADDTLCVAAKSIAEIITVRGYINLDFQDVKTILKDGGVALISTGYGEGELRVKQAIDEALHSPLLNNSDVFKSKKVLLFITTPKAQEDDQMTMEEMNEINDFMSQFEDRGLETKWGLATDDSLGKKIKVTILAAGFGVNDIREMNQKHNQEDEEKRLREAEEEAARARRREEIYGATSGQRVRKITNVFLFNEDELDNENIISTVEASPAYNRSGEQRNSIRQKGKPSDAASEAGAEDISDGGHIEF